MLSAAVLPSVSNNDNGHFNRRSLMETMLGGCNCMLQCALELIISEVFCFVKSDKNQTASHEPLDCGFR